MIFSKTAHAYYRMTEYTNDNNKIDTWRSRICWWRTQRSYSRRGRSQSLWRHSWCRPQYQAGVEIIITCTFVIHKKFIYSSKISKSYHVSYSQSPHTGHPVHTNPPILDEAIRHDSYTGRLSYRMTPIPNDSHTGWLPHRMTPTPDDSHAGH